MADTLDIISPDAGVLAALGVATGHETEVAKMVTAVSRRIDELCGPVVIRTVTEYHHGGSASIWPRATPVATVTTLKEWDGSTTTTLTEDTWGQAANADGFKVEQNGYAHSARILRRSGGGSGSFGGDVELVYQAGRYADTASVDPKFKVAAEAILRRMWDREASAWARGVDPFEEGLATSSRFFNAVKHIVVEQLSDEMRPPGIA